MIMTHIARDDDTNQERMCIGAQEVYKYINALLT